MVTVLYYGSLSGRKVVARHWQPSSFRASEFAAFVQLHDLQMVEVIQLEGELVTLGIVQEIRDAVFTSSATVVEFGVTRL
jgi:hypothetical protein